MIGSASQARDLVGVRGTALPENQIIVLSRVTRLSPSTYLPATTPPPVSDIAPETTGDADSAPIVLAEPLAEPIEDPAVDAPLADDTAAELPESDASDIALPDQINIDDVELAEIEDSIDVSDVEMFDPSIYAVPEGASFEDEFYDSSLFSRQTGPNLPLPDGGPPPGQDSLGLSGYFAGVGTADRMVLILDVRDGDAFGLFADSTAQEFSIRGEVLSNQGQARLVLFGNEPVGVLEVQLTTLGLSTVYVPLGADGVPEPDVTRSYDFVRVLSPEARRALEDLRLANIDRREAELRAQAERAANSRLHFPGDDGSFD